MTSAVLEPTQLKSVAQESDAYAAPPSSPRVPASRLTIVIPALNEEESIASTVMRCLESREYIQTVGGVVSLSSK
jgi:hypothetical protein